MRRGVGLGLVLVWDCLALPEPTISYGCAELTAEVLTQAIAVQVRPARPCVMPYKVGHDGAHRTSELRRPILVSSSLWAFSAFISCAVAGHRYSAGHAGSSHALIPPNSQRVRKRLSWGLGHRKLLNARPGGDRGRLPAHPDSIGSRADSHKPNSTRSALVTQRYLHKAQPQ